MKLAKADLEGQFVADLAHLRPKPEYLKLFHEIVLDAWHRKQADAVRAERELRRRITGLHDRRDRLEDAYLFENKIDSDTYKRRRAKLDEEIALAEMAAHDARIEELDVEGLLGFAEHLLTNAGRLWIEFPLDQRQRPQKILFPKGLTYGNDGFEPAETSVIFRMLHALEGGKSGKATPTGFERA